MGSNTQLVWIHLAATQLSDIQQRRRSCTRHQQAQHHHRHQHHNHPYHQVLPTLSTWTCHPSVAECTLLDDHHRHQVLPAFSSWTCCPSVEEISLKNNTPMCHMQDTA